MAVRSIDINKCIGCGSCVESCPMDVFRLDIIVAKKPEQSPCSLACPLGLNQREYHNLVKLDMVDEAAEALMLNHPMPSITGRICPHPCESDCSRDDVDEAININGLEQFLGDHLLNLDLGSPGKGSGVKIAIIGSGPAGLSTAYYLALAGYSVTVFERDSKPGGLLRTVIPAFRLSEEIVDKQIGLYEKMGITFKTDMVFGKDVTKDALVKEGYKVFVAATGAPKPLELSVPGSHLKGITSAMSFLWDVKSGLLRSVGSRVAVIGGGSVALDAARSAVRLGADEVHIISLERIEPGHKDSMLALAEEIEDAKREGVFFHTSMGIDSFSAQGDNVRGVNCVHCFSVRDEDGRFNPQYDSTKPPQEIEADTVICAIGQSADPELIPEEFTVNQRGYIAADELTKQVKAELFAVGDVVTGPKTVVEALAAGKRAALTVDRFLKGEDIAAGLTAQKRTAERPPKERIVYLADRISRQNSEDKDIKGNFQEVLLPFTLKQARMESERCLTCGSRSRIAYVDDCQVCRLCEHYCPTDAIDITEGQILGSMHAFNVVNIG